ncbi:PorT family protein [Hymenobacter sp. BT175]|uniref:porin family protein n=1 Tax=Hymenobacter translucens TaxID=2886507 RepID=UPI001D0E0917|nr:porin family protein [Hymenobacter translucens]MCC2546674.1 PorT family protein [Hymenobacter translucens]
MLFKSTLTALALLCPATAVLAQSTINDSQLIQERRFGAFPSGNEGWSRSFGIKAGLNRTRLTTPMRNPYSERVESEYAGNWQAGGFVNFAYYNGFSFQAEALLVQLTGAFEEQIYTGTSAYTLTRTADYAFRQIRVPLQLRYQLGKGTARPFVFAGPHLAMAVTHDVSASDKRSDQANRTILPIEWQQSAFAFGLQGGAGLYVALPNLPGFSIESVYSRGQQGTDVLHNVIYKDLSISAAVYF